mmetsp:Transcript_36208/g.84879  ORF Transcript_36208/g.84879 Transcript_36208/m.84879 type:complete len:254 (+) Transcript_36208:4188-4949(+)
MPARGRQVQSCRPGRAARKVDVGLGFQEGLQNITAVKLVLCRSCGGIVQRRRLVRGRICDIQRCSRFQQHLHHALVQVAHGMMQGLSTVRGIDTSRIRGRLQKDLHHRRSIAGRCLLKRLCVRLLDGLNCRVVHQLLTGHKQRLLLLKLCQDRPEIAGINGKHVHIIDDLLWKGAYTAAEHRRRLGTQFLRPLQDFGHGLLHHIFCSSQAAEELTCQSSRDAHVGSSLSERVHSLLGLVFRGRWRRHRQPHPR